MQINQFFNGSLEHILFNIKTSQYPRDEESYLANSVAIRDGVDAFILFHRYWNDVRFGYGLAMNIIKFLFN